LQVEEVEEKEKEEVVEEKGAGSCAAILAL